jgi:hypothetical protein
MNSFQQFNNVPAQNKEESPCEKPLWDFPVTQTALEQSHRDREIDDPCDEFPRRKVFFQIQPQKSAVRYRTSWSSDFGSCHEWIE